MDFSVINFELVAKLLLLLPAMLRGRNAAQKSGEVRSQAND